MPQQAASADPSPASSAPSSAVRVAVGVVARGGRVLVTFRRQGQLMAGWWEFPGGKVEAGEAVEAALVRELREEVGLETAPVLPLAEIVHAYPHATVRLHPFLARVVSGEPRPIEVADCRWVTREELRALAMLPGNKPLVDALLGDWAQVERI